MPCPSHMEMQGLGPDSLHVVPSFCDSCLLFFINLRLSYPGDSLWPETTAFSSLGTWDPEAVVTSATCLWDWMGRFARSRLGTTRLFQIVGILQGKRPHLNKLCTGTWRPESNFKDTGHLSLSLLSKSGVPELCIADAIFIFKHREWWCVSSDASTAS